MIRLQLLRRFSPLSWSMAEPGTEQSRGNRIGQGGREAKELQQKQQGADKRVLVGWGLVYLALQIAPSSSAV